MAVLDSCSLKHRRKAYFTAYSIYPSARLSRRKGAQNESTYVCEQSAANRGEVGDEGEKDMDDLELYVDTL